MSARLMFALAPLAAIVGATLVLLTGRESEGPTLETAELSANALVDSIGVVVHFNYADTAYGRQPELLARLRELGVRHIREGIPAIPGPQADGLRAARSMGIRATLGPDVSQEPNDAVADALAVMGDDIEAFEAPNELDNSGNPDWPTTLSGYVEGYADAIRDRAPSVPLIGPSFIDPSSRMRVSADLPGAFNGHPYPGGDPPEPAVELSLTDRRATARDRPAYFTETGYHNALAATTGHPPASEEAAAVYLPRMLVTAFGAGVERTFIYELVDEKPDPGLVDPEQHFGLLRNDLSPKPAFTAIQTLIRAVKTSPGKGALGRLAWRLQVEGEGEVERLELRRRDGSRLIALWRPVSVWDRDARRPIHPAPLPVELSFGISARDVTVWRPSVSPLPVLQRPTARRLPLQLEGDLVLVSLR